MSASLALSSIATAQCAFSIANFTSYGQPCSVFSSNPTTVGAQLDVSNCTLRVDVQAFSGCCNTYLVGWVLVVGLQPITQSRAR